MALAALLGAVLGSGGWTAARAQVHYTCDDTVGTITTCRDSHGGLYTITRDAVGETVTDSHGRMSRILPDAIGGMTIQNSDGSQRRIRPNGLGPDALGETTYEDDQGRQTRCRPSPIPMAGQTDVDCQ